MDKRLKKVGLMSLSLAMADSLKEMESESSLRRTLEMGCCVEASLAQSLAEYEMNMERDVLQPLSKLSEEELPAVLKRRKQLQKLLTDWESAKSRLSQTQRNMAAAPAGPGAATPTKLESLKEEEEELRRRVEQSKDDYLSDLYHFATKENDYRNVFIRLLELQADHHRRSLAQLSEALAELQDTLKDSGPPLQAPADVYGVPLSAHLARFGCEIAVPISACVRMLLTHGIQEEGLFRLAAGASVMKRLKASLGAGARELEEFVGEPHAVAGALKSYLRELPEPLMTYELFDDWMEAASIKNPEKRLEGYKEVCKKLPPENYLNLRYLIKFLAKLADHQEINKMTPSNIAIVLGPNLLWARSSGDSSVLDMASASPLLVVHVAEGLISGAAEVFPGDVDFGVPVVSSIPTTASSQQDVDIQSAPAHLASPTRLPSLHFSPVTEKEQDGGQERGPTISAPIQTTASRLCAPEQTPSSLSKPLKIATPSISAPGQTPVHTPTSNISSPQQTPTSSISAPSQTQNSRISTPGQTPAPSMSAPVQTPPPIMSAPVQTLGPSKSAPVQKPGPSMSAPVQTPAPSMSAPVQKPGPSMSAPVQKPGPSISAPVRMPAPIMSAPIQTPGPSLPTTVLTHASEITSTGGMPGEDSPITARKVKRPAPLRPSVPPPVQPRETAANTSDDHPNPRPIPRRNIGGSLRMPKLPPPQPPSAKSAGAKPEPDHKDSSRNTAPRPLPRNRIQSTDN